MNKERMLQDLILYIESGQKRINEAKQTVSENTSDFNMWYKYSIPEKRCNYPAILGVNTSIGKLVRKHMSWLMDEGYFAFVITLDFLLESIEILKKDYGVITQDEIDEIKEEIVELNFGSMANVW